MERELTTRYVGTSAFYIFLLDRAAERPIDVSNITAFMFGGSPTTAEVIRRLDEGFPGIDLRNMFAPTETGPAGTLINKRSEEHTSELQSLMRTSYAVFCLKKKN